jgi:hypothetical protein
MSSDGGPAFPRPASEFTESGTLLDGNIAVPATNGMSLRDYFAAHAPHEMAGWYVPTMPPRPPIEWGHDHPHERQCEREYDCVPVNVDELSAYDDRRREEYERQWPYAWADAMLAERVKAEGR